MKTRRTLGTVLPTKKVKKARISVEIQERIRCRYVGTLTRAHIKVATHKNILYLLVLRKETKVAQEEQTVIIYRSNIYRSDLQRV